MQMVMVAVVLAVVAVWRQVARFLLGWRMRSVAGQRGTQRQVDVLLCGGGSVLSIARRTECLLLVVLSSARRIASLLLSFAGADEEPDHFERAMPGGIVLEDEDRSICSFLISSAALASARLDLSESC